MDLISKITAPIGSVDSTTPLVSVEPVAAPAPIPVPAPVASPVPVDATQIDEASLLTPAPAPTVATETPLEPQPEPGKRKRGAPRGNRNAAKNDSPSEVPNIGDIQAAAQVVTVDYKLMAEATFDLTTGVAATAIGPEWTARSAEEREMVCGPLARYFEYKQVKDLPPNLALALVVVAYSAPRLREPSTASKLRLLMAWTKEKLRGLRVTN